MALCPVAELIESLRWGLRGGPNNNMPCAEGFVGVPGVTVGVALAGPFLIAIVNRIRHSRVSYEQICEGLGVSSYAVVFVALLQIIDSNPWSGKV